MNTCARTFRLPTLFSCSQESSTNSQRGRSQPQRQIFNHLLYPSEPTLKSWSRSPNKSDQRSDAFSRPSESQAGSRCQEARQCKLVSRDQIATHPNQLKFLGKQLRSCMDSSARNQSNRLPKSWSNPWTCSRRTSKWTCFCRLIIHRTQFRRVSDGCPCCQRAKRMCHLLRPLNATSWSMSSFSHLPPQVAKSRSRISSDRHPINLKADFLQTTPSNSFSRRHTQQCKTWLSPDAFTRIGPVLRSVKVSSQSRR